MIYLTKKGKSSKRAAIIDIGSESIRMIIGERRKNELVVLDLLRNMIPIGWDTFHKNYISQETINRTINILEKYKRKLKEYNIKLCQVIATTAVREARNRDVFIDTVRRKIGLDIEVFTAGDVIFYIDSYINFKLKGQYPIHSKNILVAELGAGSVEFSLIDKGFMVMNLGLPLGTLRLKERVHDISRSPEIAFVALREHVSNELKFVKNSMPSLAIDDILLISENFGYLLNNIMKRDKDSSILAQMRDEEADGLLRQLRGKSADELVSKYNIPIEIANIMEIFLITLNVVFETFGKKTIFLLETSLQEAILTNILFKLSLSRRYNKTNQLISVARALCIKFNADLAHVEHVVCLAQRIFSQLYRHIGLQKSDLLYLILAGYLHDIGKFISNRAHHKHSEYIIRTLNLFRLSDEEMKIIAATARYHRQSPPRDTHELYVSLTPGHQILVQKLSALLRVADALDRAHRQKIKNLNIIMNPGSGIIFELETDDNIAIEQISFSEKKSMLEEIAGENIQLRVKNGIGQK